MALPIRLKVKFNPEPIVRSVTKRARRGARRVADRAAQAAKDNLISHSGARGIGLSTAGYGDGSITTAAQYPHSASGKLLGSISSRMEGNVAVASTDVEYAAELNAGRPSGIRPSEAEIEAWIAIKGINADGETRVVAREIADRIEVRGMAATGFWTLAEDDARMHAADIVREELGKAE
jgi:phage gpG-like protein